MTTGIKKRGKRKLRPIAKIIMVLCVAVLAVFSAPSVIDILSGGKGIEFIGKDINLKTTQAPDYVDVQLINIGLARTGKKLSSVENIVVHYTGNPGTSAQNNRDYFNKLSTTVCSHFVIGLGGEVIQCVPLDEKSAASNHRNIDTVSIEVCHPDESGKFNENTYNSLVKLTAWLCDNSGLKETDVIRHFDVTGKECPKYFVDNPKEWENFKNDVKEKLKKYK